jgi:hypothetical protein
MCDVIAQLPPVLVCGVIVLLDDELDDPVDDDLELDELPLSS